MQNQHGIYNLDLVVAILANFIVNGIRPDKGINLLQRMLLSLFKFRNHVICHGADGSCRHAESIKIFNLQADILVAYPRHKQDNDLAFDLVGQHDLLSFLFDFILLE